MKTVKELLEEIEALYKEQSNSILKYNLLHEFEDGLKEIKERNK